MSTLRKLGAACLGFLLAGPLGLRLFDVEVEELSPRDAQRVRRAAGR